MEHNPLGTGGNAVVTLIEGRETCQDCIIIVGHVVGRFCITICCDTKCRVQELQSNAANADTKAWPDHAGDVFFSEICLAKLAENRILLG